MSYWKGNVVDVTYFQDGYILPYTVLHQEKYETEHIVELDESWAGIHTTDQLFCRILPFLPEHAFTHLASLLTWSARRSASSSPTAPWSTPALLAGTSGATRHEVLDDMSTHWMSDPVHGTKAGYSKLTMKLPRGWRRTWSPPPHPTPRRPPLGSELLLLRRTVPAPATRETFAVGLGWTPATRTALDHILISKGDGSPSPQLLPRHRSRRRRPQKRPRLQLLLEHACSVLIPASCIVIVVAFYFIFNHVQKNYKNPYRPACNLSICCGFK